MSIDLIGDKGTRSSVNSDHGDYVPIFLSPIPQLFKKKILPPDVAIVQVCADSMGAYQYSGIGGQMDFIRGASLSEGGKPIIAFPSVTLKGLSRIVPFLKEGAGVVTTRGHIHWVVTEIFLVKTSNKEEEN